MARSSSQSENKSIGEEQVEERAVDIRQTKATPLEPAKAVEMPASVGKTFSERAKANKG